MNPASVIKIHPHDDLIVALRDLNKGERVKIGNETFILAEKIPAKNQFASRDFKVGEKVRMHGVVVGMVRKAIPQGGRLRVENLQHSTSGYTKKKKSVAWDPPEVGSWLKSTFSGYHNKDGSVGTANYWVVIPLVFCENGNVLAMKEAFQNSLGYEKTSLYRNLVNKMILSYQTGSGEQDLLNNDINLESLKGKHSRIFVNVDGIKFLTHQAGCGGTREDAKNLCGLLAGYINHPNVAGATVLSLGCQNAQVNLLLDEIKLRNKNFDKPLFIFEQQKSSSEQEMMLEAIKKTFLGLIETNKRTRQLAPLSKLIIGMECGGSDGFSGLSANPVMGKTADMLVACGGSIILSEFPEFCGAEQILIDRCVNKTIANKFIKLLKTYETQAAAVGASFEMNPSPGNIREGLITDAIKSAGAIKKGGTSPVVDALDYPLWIKTAGLNLLCTPGNDVESTTAMVAAGANLILFSTGLGTPTGNPIVPVIKIASNSETAGKFADIIDFDAGSIISGTQTTEELGNNLLDVCIKVASGQILPKAVVLGHDDFIFWKRGVSL
jgi:altronate hydrolase